MFFNLRCLSVTWIVLGSLEFSLNCPSSPLLVIKVSIFSYRSHFTQVTYRSQLQYWLVANLSQTIFPRSKTTIGIIIKVRRRFWPDIYVSAGYLCIVICTLRDLWNQWTLQISCGDLLRLKHSKVLFSYKYVLSFPFLRIYQSRSLQLKHEKMHVYHLEPSCMSEQAQRKSFLWKHSGQYQACEIPSCCPPLSFTTFV